MEAQSRHSLKAVVPPPWPVVGTQADAIMGLPPRGGLHAWVSLCPLAPLSSQAKLGDEILDYRDLAALPKSKAIYNIDRPDMICYSPYLSHSAGDRQSCSEVRPTSATRLACGAGGMPMAGSLYSVLTAVCDTGPALPPEMRRVLPL